MTPGPCSDMALLVQADLDGELDAAAAATLAQHVADCAGCAELQTQLQALSGELRTGLTRHAAPASLRRAIERAAPPGAARRGARGWWLPTASFGAGLALAASVALTLLPVRREEELPEVVTAHIRGLQPGHLADVESSNQHTVKPWFNGRVDFSPPVQDLTAQGFPLIGGRLDALDGKPVAVLVYRHDKHLIDVFVAQGDRVPASGGGQGYSVVSWTQGGMVFQAVSDVNPQELRRLAQLLQAPEG